MARWNLYRPLGREVLAARYRGGSPGPGAIMEIYPPYGICHAPGKFEHRSIKAAPNPIAAIDSSPRSTHAPCTIQHRLDTHHDPSTPTYHSAHTRHTHTHNITKHTVNHTVHHKSHHVDRTYSLPAPAPCTTTPRTLTPCTLGFPLRHLQLLLVDSIEGEAGISGGVTSRRLLLSLPQKASRLVPGVLVWLPKMP